MSLAFLSRLARSRWTNWVVGANLRSTSRVVMLVVVSSSVLLSVEVVAAAVENNRRRPRTQAVRGLPAPGVKFVFAAWPCWWWGWSKLDDEGPVTTTRGTGRPSCGRWRRAFWRRVFILRYRLLGRLLLVSQPTGAKDDVDVDIFPTFFSAVNTNLIGLETQ